MQFLKDQKTVEQSAAASIGEIKIAHIHAPEILVQPRHSIILHRRDQEVDMIGHHKPH